MIGQMVQLQREDVVLLIELLENHITTREEELLASNAGDTSWTRLTPYRKTLANLKFLETTYGE